MTSITTLDHSPNPLALLGNRGLEFVLTATPRSLKEALELRREEIAKSGIHFGIDPTLEDQVNAAFEVLAKTLSTLSSKLPLPSKKEADRQLHRWRELYKQTYERSGPSAVEPQVVLAVLGTNVQTSKPTIVSDPTYLTSWRYMGERKRADSLPLHQRDVLEFLIKTIMMYERIPEKESMQGIGKAIIEGSIYGNLWGVNFLLAYQNHIAGMVYHFVEACLTKRYGGASRIAELGIIPVDEKERLFTEKVGLAQRMAMAFGGSLQQNYSDYLSKAIINYVNSCGRDMSFLLQQKRYDEANALRESAMRVAALYNFPLPPPQIRVLQLNIPTLPPA